MENSFLYFRSEEYLCITSWSALFIFPIWRVFLYFFIEILFLYFLICRLFYDQRQICYMPQTTVVLPICSIETCMHIISLCRSITNKTNLVSKIHFERDRISFFKQHVARLPLPPLKVKVQVYEYHRKIAPSIREKLCKQTLIMHILTYKIHQNAQGSPISCSL